MANREHVELVKQGAAAIARWRKQHPKKILDLKGADLSKANLRGANLFPAKLGGVNLSKADLSYAILAMADLMKANLNGADLTLADLRRANLSGAILKEAKLFGAELSIVDLSGTDLSGAGLAGANLSRADISGANLTRANLMRANFMRGNLSTTDFAKAECHFTVFADCDLSQARGLELVVHNGPSSIGIDTLIRSFRAAGNQFTPELETFFRGAGVPGELLAALPRILAEVKYCTCFICYGEPDLKFAQRLCQDLEARGVSCWLYSMDATPGERTWSEIGQKRREAEKMVVLCSAKSLVRDGVLKEIEEQIDEDPDKMVPVSLDNRWKEPGFHVMRGNRDLKPFLLERNYADFSGAMPYDEALEQLLKGLKRKQS